MATTEETVVCHESLFKYSEAPSAAVVLRNEFGNIISAIACSTDGRCVTTVDYEYTVQVLDTLTSEKISLTRFRDAFTVSHASVGHGGRIVAVTHGTRPVMMGVCDSAVLFDEPEAHESVIWNVNVA